MTNEFNARQTAENIERLAKAEIDGRVFGDDLISPLMASYSKDEIRAIDAQLKINNWLPGTHPNIELTYDQDGNLDGMIIKPALFDTDAQASIMVLGLGKPQK